jgi:peptide deformylase
MEILTNPHPLLREKCQPVKKITKEIKEIVQKMKEEMIENEGVGLAANQIGYPLRIIVCYWENKFYVFLNPEIIKFSKEKTIMEEGCLSVKGIYGEVERPEKITLKALTLNGKKIKKKFFGVLARIIQHEVDHLNGILFIDKAKRIYSIKENNSSNPSI